MKKIALVLAAGVLSACSMMPNKNVAGTYQGDLPCADCDKIQAELVLNADNTYQYNTIYFKNNKQTPYSDKGKFTWDKQKSDVIQLEPASGSLLLKVTDKYAELLDADGNPVVNSQFNYKLMKK